MASLPDHFHIFQGDLYDTREPGWAAQKPLRVSYRATRATIRNTAELKATLRAGQYAWPGGYPIHLQTSDGGVLHLSCARESLREILESIKGQANDGWRVDGAFVNWENPNLYCDHCGDRCESAYAEDGEEDADD